MRALVLLPDFFDAVGGIQTFSRGLVKALDDISESRNWTVTLLVLNDAPRAGCRSAYFRRERTKYLAFGRSKLRFAAAALRYSKHASLAIIGHVHFAPLGCGMHAMNPALRILLVVYGFEVWRKLSPIQTLGVWRADRILSISDGTRDRLAARNNIAEEKFRLLPCTLDPCYEKEPNLKTRTDLSLPAGKMILSVARLDAKEQKGIDEVIKAMPAILKDVPDAFFVVVGDGNDRCRLERLAGDMGLEKRISFVGRVTTALLQSYYRVCDVFVLPSLLEGFGIVFLEAMSHAKPCVGIRAGAIPEVIADGKTGFVTTPGDTQALARVLVHLLSDDSLRNAMGQAGKHRLEEVFSYELFRKRLEGALAG